MITIDVLTGVLIALIIFAIGYFVIDSQSRIKMLERDHKLAEERLKAAIDLGETTIKLLRTIEIMVNNRLNKIDEREL